MSYKIKITKKTHASSIENRCTIKRTQTHRDTKTESVKHIKYIRKLGHCEKALL